MEHYIKCLKYRWEVTNEYGYPLDMKGLRKIKLNKLNNNIVSFKYNLSIKIKCNVLWNSTTAFFSYSDMLLRIDGKYFKCKDLEFAEVIIESLCNGGQYVVFEKYVI
jgi:hypothetical protein